MTWAGRAAKKSHLPDSLPSPAALEACRKGASPSELNARGGTRTLTRENPHRILSPQRANPNYLKPLYLSSSYVLSILAGVGWNGVVLGWRGYKMVTGEQFSGMSAKVHKSSGRLLTPLTPGSVPVQYTKVKSNCVRKKTLSLTEVKTFQRPSRLEAFVNRLIGKRAKAAFDN